MIPLLLLLFAGADFSGTWVYRVEGRNFFVLILDAKGGTMVKPKAFRMDSDGDVSDVSPEQARLPVKWTRRSGEFRCGGDRYRIELAGPDRATLAHAEMAWMTIRLERARPSDDLNVPSSWPAPQYAPEIAELRKRLKAMVDEDQAVRVGAKISEARMEEVDSRHEPEIERIFEKYGWPKRSLVGKDAGHDFWLLVQHQPLPLQQRLLPELEAAAQQGEASRSDYAYLYDRVRIGEGKPQRWGTQAKCVNGLPVLSPVEDPAGLDERRRELRMPPLRDYLAGMKPFCAGR